MDGYIKLGLCHRALQVTLFSDEFRTERYNIRRVELPIDSCINTSRKGRRLRDVWRHRRVAGTRKAKDMCSLRRDRRIFLPG